MYNNETYILLFDGVCNLCNSFVRFLIVRDPKEKFKFATLQSESAQALLNRFGLPVNDLDSLVFIAGEKYFLRSSAILHILKELGGVWKLFYIFTIFPRPLRDFIYRIIAKTRYSIFGKRDICFVPTPEIKRRFLH